MIEMICVRALLCATPDTRIARRRVTTGVLGMEAGPQRSTRRRQRMFRRRGHHSATRTRYSKFRYSQGQTADVELSLHLYQSRDGGLCCLSHKRIGLSVVMNVVAGM